MAVGIRPLAKQRTPAFHPQCDVCLSGNPAKVAACVVGGTYDVYWLPALGEPIEEPSPVFLFCQLYHRSSAGIKGDVSTIATRQSSFQEKCTRPKTL